MGEYFADTGTSEIARFCFAIAEGNPKHISRGPRLVTTFYTATPKIVQLGFGIEDPGPNDKPTSLV